MDSEVRESKTKVMGKYYENLDTLIELIKKMDKKNLLAEFILDCVQIAKQNPNMSPHEIIKLAKKKRN
jgi:hypothetical protein